ncbi:3571_t:CDS:2, partial [Scutellospora calospora]
MEAMLPVPSTFEYIGGLPRALQHLLDICFHNYSIIIVKKHSFTLFMIYDKIFQTTIERLNTLYNIHKVPPIIGHLIISCAGHTPEKSDQKFKYNVLNLPLSLLQDFSV